MITEQDVRRIAYNVAGETSTVVGFDYVQTADPGAVGAGKLWIDLTNNRIGRRNDANTAWVYLDGAWLG